ncbi:MAG: MBOAT family protein [Bacteroidia bacterium]|nr:MBOAT family protein [Bacteroidia bacterium]
MPISLTQVAQQFSYIISNPLQFTSIYFVVFLVLVLGINALIGNLPKVRVVFLTLVSFYFYYKASGYYVVLLGLSAGVNYGLGLLIGTTRVQWQRLTLLWLAIGVNVYVLGIFKYGGLLQALYNGTHSVSAFIIPIAISFFTFENISYIVDVYKRNTRAQRNVFNYFLFISFFPKLIAGPIIRAKQFMPQLSHRFALSTSRFKYGLILITQGYLYKCILADTLGVYLVDTIYLQPNYYTPAQVVLAVLAYTLQIYFDFSGYTHIARGIACWLGIRIPLNFNAPYSASSITEFWQRWHISLSTWLRNYVYIPLGGNKHGAWRTYLNLLLTMAVGGLWHGASWQFMWWGLAHGLLLAIERLIKPYISAPRKLGQCYTFVSVTLLWVLFRANSYTQAVQVYKAMYSSTASATQNIQGLMHYPWALCAFILGIVLIIIEKRLTLKLRLSVPTFLYMLALALVMVYVALLQQEQAGFIYFQF